MKLVPISALFALFFGGAIVSAQDTVDNRVHYACVDVVPKKLMKCQTSLGHTNELRLVAEDPGYASAADFARHAKVGDLWWPTGNARIVLTMAALDIRQEGLIDRLSGEVEIHTTTMDVRADNAVYHSDTGQIEAHGDVRVSPAPAQ